MSEATGSHGAHGAPLDYRDPSTARGSSLTKIGGALGVAATFIGFAIFLIACFGYNAAFAMSPIPLAMAVPGLALVLIGGFANNKSLGPEDTHVLAGLIINIAAIVGAGLLVAMWYGNPIFYK